MPNGQNKKLDKTKLILEVIAIPIQTVAALIVIISLLNVTGKISTNNKLLRSQAYYNFLSLGHRPLELFIDNPNLAESIVRCDKDAHEVSEIEWKKCSHYYLMMINNWEYMYYQNRDESIPQQFWPGVDEYYKSQVTTSGYGRFWSENKFAFNDPFNSYAKAYFIVVPSPKKEAIDEEE